MISQFFVLNPRGNCLLIKNYKNDLKKPNETPEILFHKIKFSQSKECPPIFDYGVPQETQTKNLLKFVPQNISRNKTPTIVKKGLLKQKKLVSKEAHDLPITSFRQIKKASKSPIFIDITEEIVFQFDSQGSTERSELSGKIDIKSFTGISSELTVVFNELVIGNHKKKIISENPIYLEDINFYQKCNISRFDQDSIITFTPESGILNILNYRMSGQYIMSPFRIFTNIGSITSKNISLTIKVQSNYPMNKLAKDVKISFPVPKEVCSAQFEKLNPKNEIIKFKKNKNKINWRIKKFIGDEQLILSLNLILLSNSNNQKRLKSQIGPALMKFSLPNYSSSGLQIQNLKFNSKQDSNKRTLYVKYQTYSGSFIKRF
ncbi:ap-4 complex subunit mu-1 [Anaeramoeba flamelloides]|uniref:Ap-4 complex subunit mu-1 n=1 Tax=Anaeramoeba flamelloides TaxID=1746091 RepID=A0AAV7ZY39_9EUKA|nr:ap-4 complex subunit mu-1 [Anaeramoeba flamelloides]